MGFLQERWVVANEPQDDTQPVAAKSTTDSVQTTLEFHLRGRDGILVVVPIHRSTLECDLGPAQIRFTLAGGQVQFRNLTAAEAVYKDGQVVVSGKLEVGSFLECQGSRLLLWDHGQSTAYLKGYSAPYSGDIWPLPPGQHPVGRPGRRQNSINLDHPTVSREHATLFCQDGKYSLKAESATNPVWVGGVSAAPGQIVELTPGDLLEIGDLLFRFHWHGPAQSAPPNSGLIRVSSLGTLQCQVAGVALNDKEWKTQQIKWMFAHLAYQWGRPLPLDALIEELWPDFSLDKGKNNLNYSLSVLRQTLRTGLPENVRPQDVVLRSSSTLQLNPDLLDDHDVVTLQRSLEAASKLKKEQGERWTQLIEQAVLSYTGPFLSDCYLDWVEPIRGSLELEVLEAAHRWLDQRAAQQEWQRMIPIATQALKIDGCSSWAALHLMRAFRATKSPNEALRVYENHRLFLERELGTLPGLEFQEELTLLD